MGLEAGTTISSFITSNPTETDPVNQGDNHIRLIKAVLQAQFPGSGGLGFNTAITTTETELNSLHNSGIENLVASVHVDGSGNVGIGTASPPYKLSVTGDSFLSYTGSSGLMLRNLSGINRIDSYNYPITANYPLAILGSYIALSTSDVERMRIDASGNVGIGGTNYGNKLALHGGIRFLADEAAATTYTGIGSIVGDTVSISTAGSERMRITSAGGVSFGSSGIAYGSAGQVLISNGDAAPAWGSSLISGTAQSASGATVSFTGIPSWAKRITVLLVGVTTVGSGIPAIRAGAGSYENTGYLGATVKIGSLNATDGAASATTSWDIVNSVSSSYIYTGQLVITKVSGNQYIISGLLQYGTNNGLIVNGTKTFSGNISQLQLLMSTGADTFNGGTINIMYE